jgi:DNA polymerase III subunit delta'
VSWDKIISQNKVKSLLQRAIKENRVAHAYCFIGDEGFGKEAIAIEFAKTVNCRNPVIGDNTYSACGECSSCKMSETMQHPNISLIYSLPSLKTGESKNDSFSDKMTDELINEIKEQNAHKAENPYYSIRIPKATQIRIASIREIKRDLSLSAVTKGRRVVIVCRADEMTTEAANAFLKTLEEPQNNVTIIITSNKPEVILPTILSRCQTVHFQPLPEEEIANYLEENYGVNSTEARLTASFSQGSFSRALNFLDNDMKQLRSDVVDFFRTALKKRAYRIELIEKLDSVIKDKDKNKVHMVLVILILWLRDAVSIIKTGNSDLLINKDQVETLMNFAHNFQNKNIESAISFIEEAVGQNRRNVNQQLLLVNMFIKLRNVFLK